VTLAGFFGWRERDNSGEGVESRTKLHHSYLEGNMGYC